MALLGLRQTEYQKNMDHLLVPDGKERSENDKDKTQVMDHNTEN